MDNLKQKLKNLPKKPGVYLFKSAQGEIIYVGKAKILKNRMKSYFQNQPDRHPRTSLMISKIADLDYIIVSSEIESLILENNLIKKYRPRYNIMLRDDKDYNFIKIDYSIEIPQIYSVRQIDRSKHRDTDLKFGSRDKYFGPYTSSVKPTLKLINLIFHLCRNKKIGKRTCFAYHLDRCPGVCIGAISRAQYLETFRQVEKFLKHRQADIIKELKTEMASAAKKRMFEKAATVRDKIFYLSRLWEKQKIISTKNENIDYLGLYATGSDAAIYLFQVRMGRLIGNEHFSIRHDNSPASEIMEKFILQYYEDTSDLPKKIAVPVELEDKSCLEEAIAKARGWKVMVLYPRRGKNYRLNKLAEQNAQNYHEQGLASFEKRMEGGLAELQSSLHLKTLPSRIEGYDISNIQGTNPVGSMVVFENGKPAKSQYRKFKIRSLNTPNDFAMMKEMLARRFAHSFPVILSEAKDLRDSSSRPAPGLQNDKTFWPAPDLIIIDGGKGQLNTAIATMSNFSATADQISKPIPMIGLAKRLEEIYLPEKRSPIILPGNSPALFLLQQVRDEAHRFAVTFHRGRRAKTQTRSVLDDVPGVGPANRKKLISRFGSVSGIRSANLEELSLAVGPKLAKKLKEQL
ncbi:excinuclease ABC subunit UvrC [bacterium]|nr:MAG: excinuclease ABC subunit UvrC [bacterium]